MKVILLAASCFLAQQAAAFELFELRDVAMEARWFFPKGRHENLRTPPKKEVNFHINVDILKYGYFNNTIHSLVNESQFALIGWRYKVGLHVTPWLDIDYKHYSKHSLDTPGPWPFSFPVQDSVGVTIHFWQKNKPTALLNNYFWRD